MQKSQCNFNHFLLICESYKLFSYEHVVISKLNHACAIQFIQLRIARRGVDQYCTRDSSRMRFFIIIASTCYC